MSSIVLANTQIYELLETNGAKAYFAQSQINQEFISAGHGYMTTVSPHLEEMINTKKVYRKLAKQKNQ